ncbi:MAG: bifunctional 5,10-methylenetetrahydrofolate dehydrogenase/5,10-methenyltetrahydrofolate cyclohydrolase [Coriobacteriales bacterium]|jgi:methylenetetrahydrofolate dehydrogenase (NADP+)/methenyltetrahydrofolate cyclohydrolase|nr:bifunctional 5,10-methylenetetrahydrofolate dehydrogenase/5,10-methenyltetrahydrofolate cyclohydrolase [Coriobacteriales bacterium]
MSSLLTGKEVAQDIYAKLEVPEGATLAILSQNAQPDDLAYARNIAKAAEKVGIKVIQTEDAEEALAMPAVIVLGDHQGLELAPRQDIDGWNDYFAPCTAEAALRILDFYGYELRGKKVTVVGRSMVVGKPAAMLALAKDATVTICHSKTLNLPAECRAADVVIAAIGRAQMLGREYFREHQKDQVVIDVGINVKADGSLVGDVATGEVADQVAAITPVPGGVGAVTTAILMEHVVRACTLAV